MRDQVIALQKDNWRLLQAAAETFVAGPSYGFLISGKFERGPHRGGGKAVNAAERDRVRALQLLAQGMDKAMADPDRAGAGRYLLTLAHILMGQRGATEAWRLQTLTDLKTLPDYEEGYGRGGWYPGQQTAGAPVDADGNPIYYHVPKNFAAATNDGQRWRWALTQAAELSPEQLNTVRFTLASFCASQFGTQTISGSNPFTAEDEDAARAQADPYSLRTLTDEETVARLATGIKRFKLPDEFNFLKLFQTIADDPKTGHGEDALEALTGTFISRKQFDRAVETLQRSKKTYGDQNNGKQQRLDQILKPWGTFETSTMQPAGPGGTLTFRYRNGKQAHFEARAVDVSRSAGRHQELPALQSRAG